MGDRDKLTGDISVEIGSDVWVGGGAIICPGVKIGSQTVIGAGSVVTRDIPAGVFAAGPRVGLSERSRSSRLPAISSDKNRSTPP